MSALRSVLESDTVLMSLRAEENRLTGSTGSTGGSSRVPPAASAAYGGEAKDEASSRGRGGGAVAAQAVQADQETEAEEGARLTQVYDLLEAAGDATAEARAASILAGLSFTDTMMVRGCYRGLRGLVYRSRYRADPPPRRPPRTGGVRAPFFHFISSHHA